MKSKTQKTLIRLCVSALLIALSTALSELVPHIEMPLGGSLTPLSMLPIAFVAVAFGTKWGLGTSFVYSLIQLGFGISEGCLSWGLTGLALAGMLIFDYILPYTLIGLAGIFRNKGTVGIASGVALSVFLRFVCHFISGVTVCASWSQWDNFYLWSLCYNGAYMLPEIILTTIAALLVFRLPQIKKLIAEIYN